MKMVDLLCFLRFDLIQARNGDDNHKINLIFATLLTLRDAIDDRTYGSDGVTYAGISSVLDELINAVQHFGIAEFKVNIPTEEEIRQLLSEE